jgi:hypothetical protein
MSICFLSKAEVYHSGQRFKLAEIIKINSQGSPCYLIIALNFIVDFKFIEKVGPLIF